MSQVTITSPITSTSADITLRQGDTAPLLLATLKDDSGAAVNLTGATVVAKIRNQATKAIVQASGACTLVSAANGQISYQWVTGDTQDAGVFEMEFYVTFSNSKIESFPNYKFLVLSITPSI